jgi:Domain of unknown function (DUF4184)
MPFPLAHPAAVLPLRRFCPRFLNFPAMVMGSLSPDVGYLFGQSGLEELSHSPLGGLCFGLVVGLVMLFIFFRLGPVIIRFSLQRSRKTLLAIWQQPPSSIPILGVSILTGTATHLLLDAFTHANGWFVVRWPLLQVTVLTINWHQIRVCHFLWYLASFVGIAWLAIAFQNWRQIAVPGTARSSVSSRILAGLLAAFLVVPIEVAHHLVRSRLGLILITLLSAVLAGAAIFWISASGSRNGEQ